MRDATVADQLAWSALADEQREQYRLAITEEVRRELWAELEWERSEIREAAVANARAGLVQIIDDAREEFAHATASACKAFDELEERIG